MSISVEFLGLTGTEIRLGVEQKPDRWFEWLPVVSVGLAAVLCLLTILVLCKRHMFAETILLSSKSSDYSFFAVLIVTTLVLRRHRPTGRKKTKITIGWKRSLWTLLNASMIRWNSKKECICYCLREV